MNYLKNISAKQAFLIGTAAIILIVAIGFGIVKGEVYKKLPVPVAKINGTSISYRDYTQEHNGYTFFMTNIEGAEIDEKQAQQDVLSRLMINSLIDNILLSYRGAITQEEINTALVDIFAERTEDEFFTLVKETYGWDKNNFIKRVVVPSLTQDEVIKLITADPEVSATYTSQEKEYQASHIFISKDENTSAEDATKLLKEVLQKIEAGESFETFAGTLNQDLSAKSGGDIGWFTGANVDPQFAAEVLALSDGEISKNIVETQFGYHIVKRTGEREKMDIDAFIADKIKTANIKVYWGFSNPLATQQ